MGPELKGREKFAFYALSGGMVVAGFALYGAFLLWGAPWLAAGVQLLFTGEFWVTVFWIAVALWFVGVGLAAWKYVLS
jgi:hypothetical protein